MSQYLSECPCCHARPGSGFFDGSWFDLYACRECGKRYCYQCDGSRGGRECPRCGSEAYDKVAVVSRR